MAGRQPCLTWPCPPTCPRPLLPLFVFFFVLQVGVQVPLVVRLEGTNVEKGKEILKSSGLNLISANDLDDAAAKAVASIA